jgi:outer membrane protein assembly factor BamB
VDGEVIWSVPGFGYGSLIAVGDTLVILTEDGELISSPMTTDGYQEISRVKLVDSVCWTAPSYARGTLLVRNNQGTLICLEPN